VAQTREALVLNDWNEERLRQFIQNQIDLNRTGKDQQAAALEPTVTVLPSGATHGAVMVLSVDPANGVYWRFRYNAESSSPYRWEFLGGPPLFSEVTNADTTTSGAYVAIATAGPSVTLPRAGDFMVSSGARIFSNADLTSNYMSYDIGGTGAVDADAINYFSGASVGGGATTATYQMRTRRKAGLTAVTLTAKYRVTAGTATFVDRWMSVLPIRVS